MRARCVYRGLTRMCKKSSSRARSLENRDRSAFLPVGLPSPYCRFVRALCRAPWRRAPSNSHCKSHRASFSTFCTRKSSRQCVPKLCSAQSVSQLSRMLYRKVPLSPSPPSAQNLSRHNTQKRYVKLGFIGEFLDPNYPITPSYVSIATVMSCAAEGEAPPASGNCVRWSICSSAARSRRAGNALRRPATAGRDG